MYFNVAGIRILITGIKLNAYWKLYSITKINDIDYEVQIIAKQSSILFKYNIDETERLLFRYKSEVMIVDNEWKNIKVLLPINTDDIYYFLIQVFHTHAVRNHMIQVHSSLIEYKNSGIMFLGPSGIGKTTQAELWHQYLDALIVNGDMVFVEDKGNEFIGWGTPWHGSSPYCENTSVPVKALVVLKQGQENRIRKLEGFEKVSEVSNNIIYPMWIEDGMDLCLETLDDLLTHVPVYELVNKADEDSVLMVKQVVFDEKN